jgi:hypothetical protein
VRCATLRSRSPLLAPNFHKQLTDFFLGLLALCDIAHDELDRRAGPAYEIGIDSKFCVKSRSIEAMYFSLKQRRRLSDNS